MQTKIINTLLLWGMFSLTLNGCAVLAVGAVGAAAGATAVVATDPRNSGAVVDDNTIGTKLHFKYINNYPKANIYVNSYNGTVLLTGQVPDTKTIESVVFAAKVTPGVRKIYNYLEVRLPQSLGARSEDTLITAQIRTKIVGLKDIRSNDVKVITTNKVVYLFGILNQAQAKEVADTAANVNGVEKVVTLFEYVSG
jgi:osmotically-inducible protein OsmY